MTSMSAVVFSMAERGHFSRMKPLIAGLAAEGVTTHVFTDACFREEVRLAGGRFVDLFAGRPLESIDATSIPVPSRFVSFAGHCGDTVTREAAALRPSVVIHDGFAVIGRVVARHLDIPCVNVCAGHNLAPGPAIEALSRDPRVKISDACWHGVRLLRERHGIPDASPFSYVSSVSPDLNVYCEPPQFLRPEERATFEPIAFFGSVWPDDPRHAESPAPPFGEGHAARFRLYVSFGTIIWRYYEAAALDALEAVSEALSDRQDVVVRVSLGGVGNLDRVATLARPNIRIESYVDQWRLLRDASACITHQGLNSTHEAIFHEVSMISYPFFWDQPGLAARCQELGLAVPLTATLRGPVAPDTIRDALARVKRYLPSMRARLAEARRWELETIRRRPEVIRRIIGLVP